MASHCSPILAIRRTTIPPHDSLRPPLPICVAAHLNYCPAALPVQAFMEAMMFNEIVAGCGVELIKIADCDTIQ